VPTSIADAEILPRLREDPGYLADNDIVILDREATDPFGRAVDWSAIPAQPFPFRLQQRPGPKNPLGRIKFDMPNRFDVYLHDTPARSLFRRPVRTSSHGCIRVERALDLAAYVLGRGPEPWSRSMLEGAIASGRGQRIGLLRPLPVYILYWTALAGEDGALQFRQDVYGRDRRPATAAALEDPWRPSGPGRSGCGAPGEEAVR
jgi:murein L,D-transpeptidase YcbB/YkuD